MSDQITSSSPRRGRPIKRGEPADAVVVFRVSKARKARYVAAAAGSLTDWCIRELDQASLYEYQHPSGR